MPEIANKEMVYSFSRLSTFERCERAFYHKYIEMRPDPAGAPAVIGKIFHRAMELVVHHGFEPEDAVSASIYEHNGLPEGETASNMIYMVRRAYERLRLKKVNDEFTDIISELHLRVETDEGILQGYLDIVIDSPAEDTVEINDFKTTWQPFEAQESKQLKLYAWMYKQMRGGFVASNFIGKLIFPRRKEFADSVVVFKDEELEEAYLWAAGLIKQIESKDKHNMDEWKMTGDRKICEHCPFVGLCASGFTYKLPNDGQPKDDLEAAAIGEYLRLQQVAIKRMKEGLKSYCKKNGDIEINGGKWAFTKSEPKPKLPVDSIKKYAEKNKKELDKIFKIDGNTLKKWIEEDPTGELARKAEWTNPRKTFNFVETQ